MEYAALPDDAQGIFYLLLGLPVAFLTICFVLGFGFGHALLCSDFTSGLVDSGQLYAGWELPHYQSPDKIREGLTAGLFGCTIGGNVSIQDIFDIAGLTSRVTAALLNHLFFPAQRLQYRRVATGLTQATKILLTLVLIPIQGCNSGMIAAMVDHVIVGHAERSKITTLLHIEDIGIPLTLGIFPVWLAVAPPEPVGICSVGNLSQEQGSHFLAICVEVVLVKKWGH